MAMVRTGTAGWVYEPWRGEFYPAGLTQKNELAYAGEHLTAIEINATFYGPQRLSSFANWASQVPDGFKFPLKGPKFITHQLRLKDAEIPLANFLASGVLRLGAKLGPLVWQLPGNVHYDRERLEAFFKILPTTPEAAAELATRQDGRVKDEPWLDTAGIATIRHAIDVRHESYNNPEFIALLRDYNVAMVIADTADWPVTDITADFAYARLQGPPRPDSDSYSEADLRERAAWALGWRSGRQEDAAPRIGAAVSDGRERDVYVFFVHEDKLHAPANAMALKRLTG